MPRPPGEALMTNAPNDREQFTRTYKVPADNRLYLLHKLDKISKRAVKLGFPPIQHKIISSEPHTFKRADQKNYHTVVHTIEITGVKPVLAGWSFQGKIEHLQGGGTMIKSVADDLPKEFWNCAPDCDHCHSNRNRRNIFILKSIENGEYKQVGKNCLKDFFNRDDPHAFAGFSESLHEMDEYFESLDEDHFDPGNRASDFVPLKRVLTLAATAIRQDGYISAQRGEELSCLPTGALVSLNLFGDVRDKARLHPMPCDEKKAEAAEEWLLSPALDELADGNPYFHNLQAIARAGMVKCDQITLMTSAVATFDREMAKIEREQAVQISRHVGQIDEKISDLEVTLKFKTVVPGGQWGDKVLYLFEDTQGNIFNWYCSGRELEIPENTKVHLNGTIKKHGEYKGAAQTELTRVKINENEIYPMIRSIHRMEYAENKPAQKLLKRPLNINMRFADDLTLLDLATLCNPSFIRPLIELGAYACLQDAKGNVPAHRAVYSENQESIELLKKLAPESFEVQNKEDQSANYLMQEGEDRMSMV
jgi:hypothetical protein